MEVQSPSPSENLKDSEFSVFETVYPHFRLGELVTEKPHRFTTQLSQACQSQPAKGLELLKQVDDFALGTYCVLIELLEPLHQAIKKTLQQGNKVFLVGCGATGRLSLVCDKIFKQLFPNWEGNVVSLMAGGDVALIQSIEKFEDFPEFGARQLVEAQFGAQDLLIGITEGGETPWVIGATEKAAQLSSQSPFFLYCNPDEVLCEVAQRSAQVIRNPKIHKINLTVGPMAVAGSTRMQASTVLMASVGACLIHFQKTFGEVMDHLNQFFTWQAGQDYKKLENWVEFESRVYQEKSLICYEVPADFAIAFFTDTTERSPTFSLAPFESQNPADPVSLVYLTVKDTPHKESAWARILGRDLRCFHWPEVTQRTTRERALEFDFSQESYRSKPNYRNHKQFFIDMKLEKESFKVTHQEEVLFHTTFSELDFLGKHLAVKILINALSTTIMGKMGRYEGNIMTYVKASNFKLVDRAVRCIQNILRLRQIETEYLNVARRVFLFREKIGPSEALVKVVVEDILKEQARGLDPSPLISEFPLFCAS
jgi:N-acetylmuramic acid 6-phosphate etherase